jgi:hypothetical protein
VGADILTLLDIQLLQITLDSAFTAEEFQLMLMLGKGRMGEGYAEKAVTMQKYVECQVVPKFEPQANR